jgi:hypothetical protein
MYLEILKQITSLMYGKHNPELQKLKQELWEGNRAANPICATCNRLPTNRDRNKIKWLKKLEMI